MFIKTLKQKHHNHLLEYNIDYTIVVQYLVLSINELYADLWIYPLLLVLDHMKFQYHVAFNLQKKSTSYM